MAIDPSDAAQVAPAFLAYLLERLGAPGLAYADPPEEVTHVFTPYIYFFRLSLSALDGDLRYVMHVHSPELWRHAHTLDVPITRPDVPYGTPEMSDEVRRLFRETDVRQRRLFAMGGHEDGLVSFGRTAEEAGAVLLNDLARAVQL